MPAVGGEQLKGAVHSQGQRGRFCNSGRRRYQPIGVDTKTGAQTGKPVRQIAEPFSDPAPSKARITVTVHNQRAEQRSCSSIWRTGRRIGVALPAWPILWRLGNH